MVPLSLLEDNERNVRFLRLKMDIGIGPSSLLLLRSSLANIEEDGFGDSSLPLNWLSERSISSSDESLNRDEGILPVNLLTDKSR